MKPGHWEILTDLFAEAINLPPEKRRAFLDEACRDAPDLRADLDSLLAHHKDASVFFDGLAKSIFQPLQDAIDQPTSKSNQIISHYQVLEKLGGGGMGVVYKAHDTKLDRSLALKFLPPHLSTSDDAKERFTREAKAASALNHNNICTIYEIGETEDGRLFIAMAYYEGETLKKKIERGVLPLGEALDYTTQVARGLAKAHAHGIIHRDIKPANVIVTEPAPAQEGGIAKILDFGLAKIADVDLTKTGATMGTVAYMSPEQARGAKEVDHRTDVWSLGVVLYEMLTGERPFKGDFPDAVIYSVLNEDPVPLRELRPDLPEDLEHVVMMCLEKETTARYPSAADLLTDLEVWTTKSTETPPRVLRTTLIAGASILATLLLLWATGIIEAPGSQVRTDLIVLSAITTDSSSVDKAYTNGLVEMLTRKLRQVKGQPLWVVPPRDIENTPVTTPNEAFRMFAVNKAVLVDTRRDKDTVWISLDLVDALTEESQKKATVTHSVMQPVALDKNLFLTLADLLEINPSTLPDPTAGGTFIPGAHEFYTSGMGYLRDYGKYRNIELIDEAISQFERALEGDSAYTLVHAGLAEAYLRKFKDDGDEQWINRAIQHGQRALELNSGLLQAQITMGHIDTETGRYGSAIIFFRHVVLERDSTFSDAYLGLAKAYEAAGNLDEAENAYNQAIRTKKDYWGGYNELGAFLNRQGRYEEAMIQFQHVIQYARINPRGYRNLGSMYFYLNRKQEAFKKYHEALEVKPDDYTTHHNLAGMYYDEGLYAEAAEAFKSALDIKDTDFRVWGSMGSAYTWSGQHDKARDAYQEAIHRAAKQLDVNPRNPETLTFLAEYHAKLEDDEQADSLLTQAAIFNPSAADLLFRIGEVYEFLDQRDQALAWIEKALQKGYPITSQFRHPRLKDLFADERFQRLQEQYRRDEQ